MKLMFPAIAALAVLEAQTVNYPTSIDTDATLFITADNVISKLNQAVQTTDNVIFVASGTGFAANQIVTICDSTVVITSTVNRCSGWEHMLVTAITGQALTVTRGVAGTTAKTHANGLAVSVFIDAVHQQSLKAAILAIENALGSAATAGQLTVKSPGAGGAVQFQFQDSGLTLGRRIDTAQPITVGQIALGVQEDFNGTAGTPTAIQSILRLTNITSSQGTPAIAGNAQQLGGAATEAIGLHGQCDVMWSVPTGTQPTCVAVNAEGSYSFATTAPIGLIGYESNMNTGTVAGATPTVLGMEIQMNNGANSSTNSKGIHMHANGGTFPIGLNIQDAGGNFTNPIVVNSTLNPVTAIALQSSAAGTGDAPISIGFYRGSTLAAANEIAAIQADTNGVVFNAGLLHLKTDNNGTLTDALIIDQNQSVNIFKHLGQNAANGDVAGVITLTAATTASKTFATAFVANPACNVTPNQTMGTTLYWVTANTTAMTVTTSAAFSGTFSYMCVGNPN